MTELQEARRRWLDAEERANHAEERCCVLEAVNRDLHMRLMQQALSFANVIPQPIVLANPEQLK